MLDKGVIVLGTWSKPKPHVQDVINLEKRCARVILDNRTKNTSKLTINANCVNNTVNHASLAIKRLLWLSVFTPIEPPYWMFSRISASFLRISRIRNIPLTWILARIFVYVPPFISQFLDFIYWTVLIFILIYFEWRDTENQQYVCFPAILRMYKSSKTWLSSISGFLIDRIHFTIILSC